MRRLPRTTEKPRLGVVHDGHQDRILAGHALPLAGSTSAATTLLDSTRRENSTGQSQNWDANSLRAHCDSRTKAKPGPDHTLCDAQSKDSFVCAAGTLDPVTLLFSEKLEIQHTLLSLMEAIVDVRGSQTQDRRAKDFAASVLFKIAQARNAIR